MEKKSRIVYRGGIGELVEKKSRFIATVSPVQSEEEAVLFIETIKKKYWDARHNCSAFVLGEKQEITRCSDDGEPSGTAGRPMLEVILGGQLHNACVVVTRYFGGVLLGTGGLVRAYQGAVKEGLAACILADKNQGKLYRLQTDYTGLGKIQYLMEQEGIYGIHTEYTENVEMTVLCPDFQEACFLEKVREVTNGQAESVFLKENAYLSINGKIELI